jgi:hypothetical protein
MIGYMVYIIQHFVLLRSYGFASINAFVIDFHPNIDFPDCSLLLLLI